MPSYMDRYRAGEHVAVWSELRGLGAAVRREPAFGEALEVTREMMRRTRTNVETLVARLNSVNFQFGVRGPSDRAAGAGGAPLRDWIAPITPAPADATARLDELESERGLLPLSLRCFYSEFGSIDLRGHFPITPEQRVQYGARRRVPQSLDPLAILSLSQALAMESDAEERDFETLCVTCDPDTKMGVSGVGALEVTLPCASVDAPVWLEEPWDAEGIYFVAGLRRAFQFGGFNHLSDPDSGSGRQSQDFLRAIRTLDGEPYLDVLTHGLLPI